MGGQYHSQKTWVIKKKSQHKVWDTVLQFTGKEGSKQSRLLPWLLASHSHYMMRFYL